MWLISRRSTRTWGWSAAIGIQVVWVVYAAATRQWGFIFSALAYAAMYAKNLAAWVVEKPFAYHREED